MSYNITLCTLNKVFQGVVVSFFSTRSLRSIMGALWGTRGRQAKRLSRYPPMQHCRVTASIAQRLQGTPFRAVPHEIPGPKYPPPPPLERLARNGFGRTPPPRTAPYLSPGTQLEGCVRRPEAEGGVPPTRPLSTNGHGTGRALYHTGFMEPP